MSRRTAGIIVMVRFGYNHPGMCLRCDRNTARSAVLAAISGGKQRPAFRSAHVSALPVALHRRTHSTRSCRVAPNPARSKDKQKRLLPQCDRTAVWLAAYRDWLVADRDQHHLFHSRSHTSLNPKRLLARGYAEASGVKKPGSSHLPRNIAAAGLLQPCSRVRAARDLRETGRRSSAHVHQPSLED